MGLHLVATGGTIASVTDPETGAVRPAVAAADLVRTAPGLDAFGPLTFEEIARVSGWNVTPSTMLEVSARVEAALADPDVDGAIVTHGTDTVQETAFLCDLTVRSDKPVCFAAAMRSGDEVAADGPRSLLNAAAVARHPEARGLGTVLVMNDEVHAARWVRKHDSFRTSAFHSPDHGPLGFVTPALGVRWISRPGRRVLVDRPAALDVPVVVVQTYTGMEEGLIEAVLDATGAGGVVLEGTGLGNVPGAAMKGIQAALDRGLPVVVATRVSSGGTRAVYGGPGGGRTLRDMGVVGAGPLTAANARLLLMLLLAGGRPRHEALERFTEAVRGLA